MLTPTFHFKILNDFVGVFHDQASIMVKKLSQVADGKEFDIFNYITLCALDIICGNAFVPSHITKQSKIYANLLPLKNTII